MRTLHIAAIGTLLAIGCGSSGDTPRQAAPEPLAHPESTAPTAPAASAQADRARPMARPPAAVTDPAPPDMTVDEDDPIDLSGTDAAGLTALIERAERHYARDELGAARAAAHAVVAHWPHNVRMLSLLVSVACKRGDTDEAQFYSRQLPDPERRPLAQLCGQRGIEL